jgi:glycosyltransferase involved in cell wall biosynthesis
MPVRVLHILGSADLESTALVRLAYALARRGDTKTYEIEALFLQESGPWAEKLAAAGVRVSTAGWSSHVSDVAGALRFWRTLRERKPDLIHQHVGGRAVGYLAKSATEAPILLHVHGTGPECPSRPRTLDAGFATLAVAVSQASAPWIRGAKVEVVYPGVEEAAVEARPEPFLIGAAMRLVPVKGASHLIDAVPRLRTEFPRVRLQVAGSGPLESALKEQVRRLQLEDVVEFLGWREDLRETMARWSVFVLPSLAEGFGLAALEAMSLSIPVVASDVGGISELVENRKSGLLVPPQDASALAAAIARLLSDPGERQRVAAAARELSRSFPLKREIEQIEGIYARLTGQRPLSMGQGT